MNLGSSALRRRRKPSLSTRLKIAWVFIVIVVAAAAYAGYVLVTLPQFRISAIAVRIGGLAVSEHDVLAAANIDRSANIWLLDPANIERRIEAIPYVDRAHVERTLPARLTIDVSEREPAACVHSGTNVATLDRQQRVLQRGCARPSAIQIVLHTSAAPAAPGAYAGGAELASLLADSRILADARLTLRSIFHDRYGQLIAVDAAGVRLLFGSDADLREKAKLVGPVLSAAPVGRVIRALDLRAPATPTVEFH